MIRHHKILLRYHYSRFVLDLVPTPSLKELKKQPKEIINKGKVNFLHLLDE